MGAGVFLLQMVEVTRRALMFVFVQLYAAGAVSVAFGMRVADAMEFVFVIGAVAIMAVGPFLDFD